MLTVGTRIRIIAFMVISVVIIVYIGLRYADLGRYIGLRGYYTVTVQLSSGGGIFTDAEVTYRGVPVGRVGTMTLTPNGVTVTLNIDDAAEPIPSDVHAVVADRSAVGEQYVDLRPLHDGAPFLADGASIAQQDTALPPAVSSVLENLDSLTASVPLSSLSTVVDQLYDASAGYGPNLGSLLDTASKFTQAANNDLPSTEQLIEDSQTVLQTQSDESVAIQQFGANAELLARQLAQSNGDLNKLIEITPSAADQLVGLLQDTNPSLGQLLANLVTTSDIAVTRQGALAEALSVTPQALADGSSVFNRNGVSFGMSLTFFTPLPCTQGYGGTQVRNGLTTSPSPGLNTNARCTASSGSGQDVRGSAHAPSGGGVPAPAHPGS